MPNHKDCQHDTKSHHSIIFFLPLQDQPCPHKTQPHQPNINLKSTIFTCNSQFSNSNPQARLKQQNHHKKNRQSQSPTDFYIYFIMAKLVAQDIPCNDLKNNDSIFCHLKVIQDYQPKKTLRHKHKENFPNNIHT